MKNKILNIDHQLQRTSDMKYVIEKTKTNAGTRKLPMNDEVTECFRRILKSREAPEVEKIIDGHSGFLFLDDDGMPEVAMHWEHRFNHMVHRYNEIFREQMPNITPHVCRHTYCSLQAKAGMYPKTAVPDGPQRHQRDDEHLHAPGAGGRSGGNEPDAGRGECPERAGEAGRQDE